MITRMSKHFAIIHYVSDSYVIIYNPIKLFSDL